MRRGSMGRVGASTARQTSPIASPFARTAPSVGLQEYAGKRGKYVDNTDPCPGRISAWCLSPCGRPADPRVRFRESPDGFSPSRGLWRSKNPGPTFALGPLHQTGAGPRSGERRLPAMAAAVRGRTRRCARRFARLAPVASLHTAFRRGIYRCGPVFGGATVVPMSSPTSQVALATILLLALPSGCKNRKLRCGGPGARKWKVIG